MYKARAKCANRRLVAGPEQGQDLVAPLTIRHPAALFAPLSDRDPVGDAHDDLHVVLDEDDRQRIRERLSGISATAAAWARRAPASTSNRIFIGLACLGTAQESLEETMRYVKERKAFGRMLATFEGVSIPIAKAATQLSVDSKRRVDGGRPPV